MPRRGRRAQLLLPWEQRHSGVRLFAGRFRWRFVFLTFVAVFLTIALYRQADMRHRVRITRLAIAEVHTAITTFRLRMERCPRSTRELLAPPVDIQIALTTLPKDGWDRDLWVRCPGHWDKDEADVVSAGPSGSFFVDDNIY